MVEEMEGKRGNVVLSAVRLFSVREKIGVREKKKRKEKQGWIEC